MADPVATLREALVGQYAFERELGRGGMATVWLARDLRHDRPVALKVLHPEIAATLGADRFQREIRLAARLQHPHILSVFDSGAARRPEGGPDILWFTMPFIDGETLRDRLNRERQLPLEDALRIAREAADALEYAHREGIIHRDIKPENILLTGSRARDRGDGWHALVSDFGIARALAGAGDARLTETGLTLGTPAYMSPEQAAGDKNLDSRSDVYSLATVTYEMLAGEPPFSAPTVQAMIARRFTESPRLLREQRDTVPEAVEQAVAKGLARSAADRFGSAAEFARALELNVTRSGATAATRAGTQSGATPTPEAPPPAAGRKAPRRRRYPLTAALAVGFLIGLGVLFGWMRRQTGGPTEDGARRLAVLPFENMGQTEDGYFADGVTDEIRGKLSALPGLQVTARSSSSQYKGTSKTPAEIGRELGVDYLLTGTVRWEKGANGSRVRVSPELIQVSTGSTRWQEPFDAALTDVFQVQADVAGRVAQALNLALGAGERERLAEKPTQNLTAYDAYLKGEEASDAMGTSDVASLRQAIEHYEAAVAVDSSFSLAWARIGQAHASLYFLSAPTPAEGAAARAAAERALALAPERPEGHLAMGDYHYRVSKQYERAAEQYALGQKSAPRNAELLVATALTEQTLGRWEEALQHLQQAWTLDPRSLNTARRLSRTLLWLRRYPEALRLTEEGLVLSPTSKELIQQKAMVSLAQGDLATARGVLRTVPPGVTPAELVAYVGNYWDLSWALDDEQQRVLVGLSPAQFDDDRGAWGGVLAQTYKYRGDETRSRAYADSSLPGFESQLRDAPNDAQLHALHGLMLALSGHKAEATQEGERSIALQPVSKDAYSGAYNQHLLARIYILTGEPEKAIDQLEALLKIPYYLSQGWLRIDPTFDPLRKNPRFQRLVGGTA
ncbi:MAG TPA: protein kinase [Gemmatimonadales bacterium]|nr:protein kinase [Gemmatimonadales bacterium]